MDIAIVTGAETPLGLRLIERLIRQGCRVHGIGNNFSKVTYADRHFVAHAVDLTDLAALRAAADTILEAEKRVDILIHAIDVTPGGAFEKLPVGNLEAVLKIGLLGPVMLTRLLLPNLLRFRGRLINIIPANKSGTPASAVNALLEGGLREMNRALFDTARNAGLRATNLILRQNQAPAPVDASDRQLAQSRIDPAHVARAVEQLLDANATNVPDEITLHPPLSPEAAAELPATPLPLDPYGAVVLPPKEYFPPEPEPILTEKPQRVERLIPYTDDELEDKIAAAVEDFEAHPERYLDPDPRQPKRDKRDKQPQPDRSSGKDHAAQGDSQQGGGGSGKNKRRRRRGGRNRNKNRDEQGAQREQDGPHKQPPAETARQPQPESKHPTPSQQPPKADPGEGTGQPKRSERDKDPTRKPDDSPRSEPRPRPSETPEPAGKARPEAVDQSGGKTPSPEPKQPVKQPAKKKTAKKAAKKKSAKKKAAKKATKKRAAKKSEAPPPPADA